MWPEEEMVTVLTTRWPSTIAEAEELLESSGIPYELVEPDDDGGDEWRFRVPREVEPAARELLAGLEG